MLSEGEPEPVDRINACGGSPYVLTCEHAGRAVPSTLGDLGIAANDLERHIGWDIGAFDVARQLAEGLDAPLFAQPYSRLVIDCNRPAGVPSHIPEMSDGTMIPANQNLTEDQSTARHATIHAPYHKAISTHLDARQSADRLAVLVSVHSFTPALRVDPEPRPWDVGLLSRRGMGVAEALHDALSATDPSLIIAHNEPYQIEDDGDFTIPVHGEFRRIPHVLIEIRQDRIATSAGQKRIAETFAKALCQIAAKF